MSTIKLTEDEFFDAKVVSSEIVDQGRWDTLKEFVISVDGKYYQGGVVFPSTENSGDVSDMNDWPVEFTEVRQVEKLVKVWEPVKDK